MYDVMDRDEWMDLLLDRWMGALMNGWIYG